MRAASSPQQCAGDPLFSPLSYTGKGCEKERWLLEWFCSGVLARVSSREDPLAGVRRLPGARWLDGSFLPQGHRQRPQQGTAPEWLRCSCCALLSFFLWMPIWGASLVIRGRHPYLGNLGNLLSLCLPSLCLFISSHFVSPHFVSPHCLDSGSSHLG